jgi:hypothetical protein
MTEDSLGPSLGRPRSRSYYVDSGPEERRSEGVRVGSPNFIKIYIFRAIHPDVRHDFVRGRDRSSVHLKAIWQGFVGCDSEI